MGSTLDEITFACPGTCSNDHEIDGSETWNAGTLDFKKVLIKEKSTLTINGDVIVYIKEDFIIEEKSDIVITSGSSLTIYVDKKVEFKEKSSVKFIPGPDRAEDFVILGTKNADSIKLEEKVTFVGAIYAPNADTTIEEKVDLTGAVIVGILDVKEKAAITYDSDVMNISSPVGGGGGGTVLSTPIQYFSN